MAGTAMPGAMQDSDGRAFWVVVLAAGAGSRFGSPKPLMVVGDTTALESVVRKARSAGAEEVVVVTGHHRAEVSPAVEASGAKEVQNPRPQRGMMSSVRCGAAALPDDVDLLVWPVDHPYVTADTLIRLCQVAAESRRRGATSYVVIPTHGGRRGHPTLYAASLVATILAMDDAGGLNRLHRSRPEVILELEVPDGGVIIDVDRPQDLVARPPGT